MENRSSLHNVTFTNWTGGDINNASAQLEPPTYIVVTSSVLYILIFIVGILGNLIVILVISCSRKMKTSVNMYLMNLCIADILVILVCMPTALADIYTKEVWYFGEVMCKMVPFLEGTVASASILTILAISIERYRVVCYPLKGIDEHMFKIWMINIGIWMISLGASSPMLTIPELRSSQFHDGTPIQVCRIPIVSKWQKGYVLIQSILFFLVPCVLLFTINCHLCRVLRATRECDDHITANNNRNERKRRQHQVLNILASIVLVFFICHLPYRIAVLWFTFEDKHVIYLLGLEKYLNLVYSTRIIFYLNHALNPVVYNFVSTKFRSALKDLFSSRKRTLNQSSIATDRSRQNKPLLRACNDNTVSTFSRHSVTATKITGRTGNVYFRAKENMNEYHQEFKPTYNANHSSQGSLSSTDKEYDMKIQLENNTVAFKFSITKNKPVKV